MPEAAGAEHPRSFEDMRLDRPDAGVRIDDRRHEGRKKDNHDLRAVAKSKPEDRQRNPGERRDRPDEGENRGHEGIEAAARPHEDTKRRAERDGNEKAHEDQAKAAERMLPQVGVGIPRPPDLARRLPDLRRRGKPPGGDEGGERGGERPKPDKHERRASANENATATSTHSTSASESNRPEKSRRRRTCQFCARGKPHELAGPHTERRGGMGNGATIRPQTSIFAPSF